MNKKKKPLILLAIILMCILQGATYIWTVFQPYIQNKFQLSQAASSLPFTILTIFFAIGNFLGGILQKKLGLRSTVTFGNILTCVGFAASALASSETVWLFSVGFGIFVGSGAGCAFNALIIIAQIWFPDQKGMITGVTVGSVGISCALLNPICDFVLSLAGYQITFWLVALVCLVFSFSVLWIPQKTTVEATCTPNNPAAQTNTLEYILSMLKIPAFSAVTAAMALIVPSYYLLSPLVKSLGIERGLSNSEALICVVVFSVFNIIGRFIIPWASDHLDRKMILRTLYILSILSVFGLVTAENSFYLVLTASISMIYGGVVGIFPIMIGDSFGSENQGIHLGIVLLGTSVTAFICPLILSVFGIEVSFIITGIGCIVGLWLTKKF